MFTKITINVTQILNRQSGERLRQSLRALPGVKQVTVTYPHRVEVLYDGAVTRASNLMTVIRAHGYRTGLP